MECREIVKRNWNVYSCSQVGAISACLAVVCYFLIQSAREQMNGELGKYREQLAKLNPAQIEAWEKATQYEAFCQQIRSDYLNANKFLTKELETYWTTHHVRVGGVWIPIPLERTRWVTRSRFVPNISSAEFTELVQNHTSLYEQFKKTSSLVNRTPKEAFESIFQGCIPSAGPSPIPLEPKFGWLLCWTTFDILFISSFALGGLAVWR